MNLKIRNSLGQLLLPSQPLDQSTTVRIHQYVLSHPLRLPSYDIALGYLPLYALRNGTRLHPSLLLSYKYFDNNTPGSLFY